jgi:hypothetical protein
MLKHSALRVWVLIFVYAIVTSCLIQLVILPYLFPQLHAGNGLLAGRDWVGFHEQAIVHAQEIVSGGWEKFRLRTDGDNAIIGVAAFFYKIFIPKPWVLLPLSAAMFATGGLALFCMLKQLDLEDGEAGIALLPYLFFPSALLQYGQIHKDVFCTAGVLVVLWSWVSLLKKDRKGIDVVVFLILNFVALMLVSVFRPYLVYPFLGFGAILLAWHVVRTSWQFIRLQAVKRNDVKSGPLRFNLQSTAILSVLCASVYVISTSYLDVRFVYFGHGEVVPSIPVPVLVIKSSDELRSADDGRIFQAADGNGQDLFYPDFFWGSKNGARRADEGARIKSIQACRPIVILREDAFIENTINRVFLKIAVARAGFTNSGGTTVASNIDWDTKFCKNADLIGYVPRALQIAFFAPFPSQWLSTEKRNSSAVEIYISAVEMFYCYVAYLGLLYWLFSYKRWNMALMIPISFAVGVSLLLGLTVANVGTLYRMRFPFAMIFVSIGMAGLMQMARAIPLWLERVHTANDQ